MKKISFYWALLVGLLSVVAQISIFTLRFGRWNADASLVDFLLFFVAGALGGWILIYALNGQTSTTRRGMVLVFFLLISPAALLLMLSGGLIGWVGVLLFPQIPWALFLWFGSLLGRLVLRG